MKKYLLKNGGDFYRANLHVHTTVSDGDFSPEEVKQMYMEKGYSIVAFTDHEVMVPHPELTDEHFVALTATEISTNSRFDCDFSFAKTYHLNIYSPDENRNCFSTFDKGKMWLEHSYQYITDEQEASQYNRIYDVEDVNKVIKMANEQGCLVSYNHPGGPCRIIRIMQTLRVYGGSSFTTRDAQETDILIPRSRLTIF